MSPHCPLVHGTNGAPVSTYAMLMHSYIAVLFTASMPDFTSGMDVGNVLHITIKRL